MLVIIGAFGVGIMDFVSCRCMSRRWTSSIADDTVIGAIHIADLRLFLDLSVLRPLLFLLFRSMFNNLLTK